MVAIDRREFIRWMDGELMSFEHGKGFVVNEASCTRAEEEVEKGNDILFTVGGKVVSRLDAKICQSKSQKL